MSTANQAVLRFALAAMAADPQAEISARFRQWIRGRLCDQRPLAPPHVTILTPSLLTWAETKDARMAAALRQALGLVEAAPDPQASGLDVLQQYPGAEGREQAEALREPVTPKEHKG